MRMARRRRARRARRARPSRSAGKPGKDVVWVPTPQATVDKMLELTKVTAKDYVIDLGSGNGITVISAAKKGATALGVEFNPDMVALSQRLAKEAGVSDKATFVQGDLFEADLSKATVITLFLLPDINLRLRPKLLDLKPGTRIASNTFDDGRLGTRRAGDRRSPCTSWCTALSWVVPAKVAGTWQLGDQTLTLTQQYQVISGTLGSTPITGGRLNGEDITFTAGNETYTGRVNGDTHDRLRLVGQQAVGDASAYPSRRALTRRGSAPSAARCSRTSPARSAPWRPPLAYGRSTISYSKVKLDFPTAATRSRTIRRSPPSPAPGSRTRRARG